MSRVLLVTGAGRSGTSTVAGSLKLLGLHIPQPEVPADETNPRGFFESQWVVAFHKELLFHNPVVRTMDSRPDAQGFGERLSARPDAREALDAWLVEQLAHPQVLVKDPRAFWVHTLWREVAAAHGADIAFLTMVRHPVEVAKSRDAAYLTDRDDSFRRRRVIANVAAWCNAAFVSEDVSRPDPRAFVRYDDLLDDWRTALAPAVSLLGLHLEADLASRDHHPVDDFIDSALRRSRTTWDETDVPEPLRRVADGVWEQMDRLADDPADPAVAPALAALQRDYGRIHDDALAIALDHTNGREVLARRQTKGAITREFQDRIAELEQQLEDARGPGLARRVARRVRGD